MMVNFLIVTLLTGFSVFTPSLNANPKESFIIKQVEEMVASVFKGDNYRYHVEIKRLPNAITNKEATIKRVWPINNGIPKGYTVYNVDYSINGSERTAKVQLFIQVSQQLPVPINRIEGGTPLNEDLFVYQWIDITTLRGDFVHFADETNGKVAAGFMKNGYPIRPSDLMNPPLIQPGNAVVMVYQENGIQLALPVVSRQSGAKNEFITVWCEKTRKTYKTKVINSEQVVWEQTL